MKKLFVVTLLINLFLIGCTQDTYTKKQLINLTLKHDPNASIILPENIDAGIKCTDYGEGCKSAHIIRIQGLDTIFVEFKEEKFAKKTALRINAYYKYNWLFDDVTDEPILEKFFKKVYGAKNARVEWYAKKKKDKE